MLLHFCRTHFQESHEHKRALSTFGIVSNGIFLNELVRQSLLELLRVDGLQHASARVGDTTWNILEPFCQLWAFDGFWGSMVIPTATRKSGEAWVRQNQKCPLRRDTICSAAETNKHSQRGSPPRESLPAPNAPSSFSFLVVRPGAPSSVRVPSGKARSP